MNDHGSFPAEGQGSFLRQLVQTGSGAHSAFYPKGTGSFFIGVNW
jgi:hypothetical protein